MKKLNLKETFALLAVIFVTTAFQMTGCSKQENKTTTVDTTKKSMTQEQSKQETTTADKQTEKNNTAEKEEMMESTKDNASVQHAMINIPSAQCDICQEKIEKALKKVAGVKNYKVDVEEKIVHVNFDKSVTNLGKIENAITAAGYDANEKKANPDAYSKLDDCCKLPKDRKKKNNE